MMRTSLLILIKYIGLIRCNILKLIGYSELVSKNGYLIAKPYSKDVVKTVGLNVYDVLGRRVGIIVDVIGRVDNPRLVIKLLDIRIGELLASRREPLYYVFSRQRRKKTR